jgi:chemotaxis protein methyltransferase CheR
MAAATARMVAPISDTISPQHFRALAALIYSATGIRMPPSKTTMLEGRLRRRVRDNGYRSIADYCAHILSSDVSQAEMDDFLNAVTTNKTDFFRERNHFDFLVSDILPQYQERGQRMLRCWSAASSNGAEPYTLAMVLDDYAQSHGGPDYEILATDLDTEMLQTGVKGIYPAEMLEPVPAALRRRYVMEPKDPSRREVRIAAALRKKVSFGRLNLMSDHYAIGNPVDIIFCRNVLIYFDKPTQHKVVTRLCEQLRPGGYLLLGHSESIAGFSGQLKTVCNTVFQKV